MGKQFKVYTLRNFKEIPQIRKLTEKQQKTIEYVGNVLPFKVNNYVTDELINWSNIPEDPVFQLTFPQKGMLTEDDFGTIKKAHIQKYSKAKLQHAINAIRFKLNPNPAGQKDNIPEINGIKLTGIQHKYNETVLFFPSNCQTCHAYCTFCFRWPQFVGIEALKFAMKESELLAKYVKAHPEVTDVLFTGGDPMVMSAKAFDKHINTLLNEDIPNLQTIRIGTKSLSYWPYRYLTDNDADDMLRVFEKIVKKGYHLALMAHFNHPQELSTKAVEQAIKRIQSTGAQIRTQSPIMQHINDSSSTWQEMWNKQVNMGLIPYYMFIARDTGAQDYFAVELVKAWHIYRNAYQKVSGIARTVRGPSMSAGPGKVQIAGVADINNEKVLNLQFIQGKNPEWVGKPFFAEYNPDAVWLDDLEPAFGKDNFFFEKESCNKFALN